MIVTLTPNPAWDITVHADAVIPGGSHRVRPGTARAGGKGVNVARVLDQQGFAVHAVLPVGGSTGELITADLSHSGLAHTAVPITGLSRRTVAIVDDGTGETSIFNETGPDLTPGDADDLLAHAADAAQGAGIVVGSGSLPPGCPADFYPHLVQIAHNHDAQCIIDASGPALVAAADAGADLVKPNVEEIRAATGITDPLTAAAHLLERGAARVLLTDGPRGMYDLMPGEPTLHAWIDAPVTGNATGAGDAAVAAAATALTGSPRREDLLRLATAWSASAVTMPDAGLLGPTAGELERAVRIAAHPPSHQ